jgi:hypothetical protein
MLIELNQIFKLEAVKIGKELKLGGFAFFGLGTEVFDDVLGVNLLLNVDRHSGHFQVFGVLLVLTLPDKLRVEGGVAGIENSLWFGFVLSHEVAQLLSGYIGTPVLMSD